MTRAAAPPTWMENAACAGIPTNMFFPETGQQDDIKAAKRVCASCPVRQQCRDYAITTGQQNGIWGGHSARALNRKGPAS